MTPELQKIKDAPELGELRELLTADLSSKFEDSATFDPILVLMIISLIVQVVSFCFKQKDDAALLADIRNVASLPPRKLMRFKRRANVIWRDYCKEHGLPENTLNPIMAVSYSLGEKVSEPTISAILAMAK